MGLFENYEAVGSKIIIRYFLKNYSGLGAVVTVLGQVCVYISY